MPFLGSAIDLFKAAWEMIKVDSRKKVKERCFGIARLFMGGRILKIDNIEEFLYYLQYEKAASGKASESAEDQNQIVLIVNKRWTYRQKLQEVLQNVPAMLKEQLNRLRSGDLQILYISIWV